jgi:hypothetical protein
MLEVFVECAHREGESVQYKPPIITSWARPLMFGEITMGLCVFAGLFTIGRNATSASRGNYLFPYESCR